MLRAFFVGFVKCFFGTIAVAVVVLLAAYFIAR